eukprot:COSAG02_NODE_5137_length_4597_cov_1.972210_6_plen_271_part_00
MYLYCTASRIFANDITCQGVHVDAAASPGRCATPDLCADASLLRGSGCSLWLRSRRAHRGLLWTLVREQGTTGSRQAPPTSSPLGPSLTNMVHCTVTGDGVFGPCHAEVTCTASYPHRSNNCTVVSQDGVTKLMNLSCCPLPPDGLSIAVPCAGTKDRLSCSPPGRFPLFSKTDIAACAEKECRTSGFDPSGNICQNGKPADPTFPQCMDSSSDGSGTQEMVSSASCSTPPAIIAGSFDWKLTYAVNHGCVVVGGLPPGHFPWFLLLSRR